MYDHNLKAFVAVAECGSFTKAADKVFLTPTAVMKQVNTLEGQLGLKLTERTPSGVRLTKAGEIIYKGALFLMDYADKTVQEAKDSTHQREKVFRVGTSLLYPAKPFMDLWYQVCRDFPDFKLLLVPFEDNHEEILSVVSSIGERFDFLYGVCDSKRWLERCSMQQVGKYRKMVAIPRNNPLSHKERLSFSDLDGKTLMMVSQGDSGANDAIREDLRKNHPLIHIEDTGNFYDMTVFNRAVETGNLLLTLECWKDVHPELVTVPVDWDYVIPYGLVYAKNPSKDVERFVTEVGKMSER